MVRRVGVVAAFSLFAAACSAGGDPGPTAAVPTAPPSTATATAPTVPATTVPGDPFAIPEVIDEAYVNRVLEALYAIDGDVTRKVVATGLFGIEDITMFFAIYAEPQRTLEIDGLKELVAADRSNFRRPPGDRRVRARRIRSILETCIVAEVTFDYSEVVHVPAPQPAGLTGIVALVRADERDDSTGVNPTPWAIIDAEYVAIGEEPDRPCE